MKKLFIKICAVVAGMSACLGFTFSPVLVSADESPLNEVYSIESVVSEEVIEEEETSEEIPVLENETNTFENFLEWTKQEAEKYGHGNEYSEALEAIKTAATTKQVTISTVASFSVVFAFLGYLLYKKVTDKQYRKKFFEFAGNFSALLDKMDELVDGTNANTKEEQALKEETQKCKKAIANLVCGFMHFTSGVGMKETKKAEVQRDCINALKEIDSEAVSANEDNQK